MKGKGGGKLNELFSNGSILKPFMLHFHLFFTAPHSSHGTNFLSTKTDTVSSHRQIVAGRHRKAILGSFLLGIS